jgi:hypothetical protein
VTCDGDLSDRRCDDLFVVSNLGQARNVVAVARSGSRSARVMAAVVGSESNRQLLDRLTTFLSEHGTEAVELILPERPTSPAPRTISEVARRLERFSVNHPTRSLWIANTNAFYSTLAATYSACGSDICYYEDGIGTYRRADDLALTEFEQPRVGGSVRRVIRSLNDGADVDDATRTMNRFLAALRNLRVGLDAAKYEVCRHLSRSNWYQRALQSAGGSAAAAMFHPWSDFSDAAVVFPDVLDRRVVRANRIQSLDIRPDPRDIDAANAVLNEHGVAVGATLFVSQPYCDRGPVYYGAVGRAVNNNAAGPVVVLVHPRERDHHVKHLLEALGTERVAACLDVSPNAEAVLATGRFSECLGITSSTLAYARFLDSVVVCRSIASEVIDDLTRSGRRIPDLDRLRVDLQILDRVLDQDLTERD